MTTLAEATAITSEHVKIVTQFWAKPIPDRRFDWCATFDNYEEGSPIGFGATEVEAIDDLMMEAELRA